MDNILERWKRRDLTIFGKVQVIKSLALGSLIYTASCCPTPGDVVDKINKILFSFIWGKTEKIKRDTLIGSKCNGGVNMVDIQSQLEALKAAWIPRIMTENNQHWKELPKQYINKLGTDFYILKTTLSDTNSCPSIKSIPSFYQEVIISFTKSKIGKCKEIDVNQPLFGNQLLTYGEERKAISPYFINWINSGILTIKDLSITDGKLNEQYIYEKVSPKQNIYSEITIIKKCLKPYKDIIGTNIPKEEDTTVPIYMIGNEEVSDITVKKSKFFYNETIKRKVLLPKTNVMWTNLFMIENIDFEKVYCNKVVNIKDNKLAETNYKILHNILPCGENLLKWKRKDTSM